MNVSRGMGQGMGGGRLGRGPPTRCRCPNCGYEAPHIPGIPCINQKCPKCNVPLRGAD